jgi:hypothetical protein
MTDITERLTYGNVLAAPLLLTEAVETIQHLRADLERERRWIRQLETCVLDNIHRDYDRKNEQG